MGEHWGQLTIIRRFPSPSDPRMIAHVIQCFAMSLPQNCHSTVAFVPFPRVTRSALQSEGYGHLFGHLAREHPSIVALDFFLAEQAGPLEQGENLHPLRPEAIDDPVIAQEDCSKPCSKAQLRPSNKRIVNGPFS